jgi:hypothetical protein
MPPRHVKIKLYARGARRRRPLAGASSLNACPALWPDPEKSPISTSCKPRGAKSAHACYRLVSCCWQPARVHLWLQHRPPNVAGRVTPQTAQFVEYQWDPLSALLLENIDRPLNPGKLIKAIDPLQ